jgi:YbgC/YbaW family acyl-CoA thioester hydrolase
VVLRYLEHTRWQSASDPTIGLWKMFRDGHRIVVRAQQLELLQAVGLQEELRISLWVARIGRASMDMRSEIHRTRDEVLVARAVVTTVNLSPDGRPCAIPRQYVELIDEPDNVPLVPAPPAEPPPAHARRTPLAVLPSHLDLYGHVNHANYLTYFDDARMLAARERWYGDQSTAAAQRLRAVHLDYRREALLGDTLDVVSWQPQDSPNTFVFELVRPDLAVSLCRARIVV